MGKLTKGGLACACVKGGGGGSCCGLEERWGGGGKVGAFIFYLCLNFHLYISYKKMNPKKKKKSVEIKLQKVKNFQNLKITK